ncbi:MAG: hypothetical protein M1379_03955 [Firmicutes bacterium]|nr:hypothetical protein [Bacillota bacterium]
MKRTILFVGVFVSVFLVLLAGLAMAGGIEPDLAKDSDRDYPEPGSGKKDLATEPVLGYNPLDGWYLGAAVTRKFDNEGTQAKLLGRYGFLSKQPSGLIAFNKALDRLYLGASGWNMVSYRGIYGEYPMWEYSTGATVNLGYRWDATRVRLGLTEKEFRRALYDGPRTFDQGHTRASDLLLGWSFPGFTAYTRWDHGFPARENRFEYDSFQLTGVKVIPVLGHSNFTIAARGAAINGVYPRQDGLFLGDERFSFDSHFLGRVIGLGETLQSQTLPDEDFTGYFLRGYPDKAFEGDRMYVVNLEYGKSLLPGILDTERFQIEAVTFLDIGDAWFSGVQAPGEPKIGGGAGLKAHIAMDEGSASGRHLFRPGIVISAELARGVSEQGRWRFGISAGVSHRF